MSKLFVIGAILPAIVAATLNGPVAIACSCAEMPPPKEAVEEADAVFTGEVVEVRVIKQWQDIAGDKHLDGGGIVFEDEQIGYTPVLYTRFDVFGVWKGVDSKSVWVRSGYFGASCGYKFKVGGRYLVYGYWSEEDRVLATGYCTRTASLSGKDEPEDIALLPEPSYALSQKHRDRVAVELRTGKSIVVDGEMP